MSGDTSNTIFVYPGLVHWVDENEIGERAWMGLKMEKALWMLGGP
jgi:hypothetical protein